eukprot:PhM_4_TR16102/c0_g1_i1/m.28494
MTSVRSGASRGRQQQQEQQKQAQRRPTAALLLGLDDDDDDDFGPSPIPAATTVPHTNDSNTQNHVPISRCGMDTIPVVADPRTFDRHERNEILRSVAARRSLSMVKRVSTAPALASYKNDKEIRRKRRKLEDESDVASKHLAYLEPVGIPANEAEVLSDMRPYQREGVHWMYEKYLSCEGAVLGDDMGLGKTAQVCKFLQLVQDANAFRAPNLVVAPRVTLLAWIRELTRWAPRLKGLRFLGNTAGDRGRFMKRTDVKNGDFDVLVVSYETFRLEQAFFTQKLVWRCVVIDEAHNVKSSSTQVTKACRRLECGFRLALTGTPIQNRLEELWCLLGFLFSDTIEAKDEDEEEIDDEPNADSELQLLMGSAADTSSPTSRLSGIRRLVAHVMLRRTKANVAKDLPKKTIEVLHLEATIEQKELSRALCQTAVEEGTTGSSLLGLWVHLRKVACHPLLVDLLDGSCDNDDDGDVQQQPQQDAGGAEGAVGSARARLLSRGVEVSERSIIHYSAKMLHLDTILPRLKSEGHRVVIFSTFRSMLDLVEVYFEMRGFTFYRMDGSTPQPRREIDMLRYNHPSSDVFAYLMTTTTGGVGITLTGADTLILLDPHCNPSVDAQAIDRVYRLGQTRDVTVYRFVVDGSVEKKIAVDAERKIDLGDQVMNQKSKVASTVNHVTLKDLQELLEDLNEDDKKKHMDKTNADAVARLVEGWTNKILTAKHGAERTRAICADVATAANNRSLLCHTDTTCFECGEESEGRTHLLDCAYCTKRYHGKCATSDPRGAYRNQQLTCPRHKCKVCLTNPRTSGSVLFMCFGCTASYCFDDMDPRYYTPGAEAGLPQEALVSPTYLERETDGMPLQNNVMYFLCEDCVDGQEDHTATQGSSCYGGNSSKRLRDDDGDDGFDFDSE